MRKLSDRRFFFLFVSLFLILNILNSYVVTLTIFNPGLNLYKFTPYSFLTSFLGDLGFLLILLGIVLLFSRNKRTTILNLTIITIFLSTTIFMLKIYSFFYGTAFSFFNMRTFSNNAPILSKQLTIFLWKNLLTMGQYVAIFPAIILFALTVSMYRQNRFPVDEVFVKKPAKNYIRLLKVLILGLGFYSFSLVSFQYSANAEFQIIEDLESIQNMGVYTYLSTDLVGYLTYKEGSEVIDEDRLEHSVLHLKNIKKENPLNFFGEETSNTEALFEDKSLIIIQIESFNTYLIDLFIENPNNSEKYEVTPFLNSLANDSNNLFYSNFYSNIGVGKTTDAEFATLTGIMANGNIVTYYDYITQDYETLPKLFSSKGYETYALRGSNEDFYRRNDVYPKLGFNPNNLVSEESLIAEGRLDPLNDNHYVNGWVEDSLIYNKLLDIIDPNEKQFIFSLTTVLHSPFAEHKEITGVNEWSNIVPGQIGRYLDYARYTDNILKDFYFSLEEKGVLEDYAFVIYGDHKSDISMKEHSKLFPEALNLLGNQKISHNVPLIISALGTDLSPYNESTNLVRGQSDLKRTISNLFGLEAIYKFGVDILTTDKTVTYVPLTTDIFTDEFHLNYRGKETDNHDVTLLDIEEFIRKFDYFKTMNDSLLYYNFFGDLDDET